MTVLSSALKLSFSTAALLGCATLFTVCDAFTPCTKPPCLRDATFRCCWVNGNPFNFPARVPPYNVGGLNMDFFLRLQSLTGFHCATMSEYTDDGAVGWARYLRDVSACADPHNGTIAAESPARPNCTCDLAAGTWFEAPERDHVQFLPPVLVSDLRVATHIRNTRPSGNPWLFVDAFHPRVWALLAVLIAAFTAVKMLDPAFAPVRALHHSQNRIDGGQRAVSRARALRRFVLKNKFLSSARKSTESALEAMIGISHVQDNLQPRHWILNYTICLSGLIIVLIYEATMTAKLVQEDILGEFNDYNDILTCKIKNEDMCIVSGDIVETIWKVLFANRKCNKGGKPVRMTSSYTELFEAVANGTCKYALSESGIIFSQQHGRYCGELVTIGEPFWSRSSGMVVPKNWPYYEELRLATLEILESNIVPVSMEEYVAQRGLCKIAPRPVLTLGKLRFFFLLVAVVLTVFFVYMCCDPAVADRADDDARSGFVEKDAEISSEFVFDKHLGIESIRKPEPIIIELKPPPSHRNVKF